MPKSTDLAAHAMWSGTLSFGLVSLPVYLFPAHRSGGVHARMLDRDGTPLQRRFYSEIDGREVGRNEIARGIEGPGGQSIVVTDEELDHLAPRKSRDIDLRLFTKAKNISPLLFERSYFLLPGGESTKAYRLLAGALEKLGVVGIATFVMREKEYLVAIAEERGLLRADSLRFAEEVRDLRELGLSATPAASPDVIAEMEKAIGRLSASRLSLRDLKDGYAERVRALLRTKQKRGKDVFVSREPVEDADSETPDLLQILRRSLKQPGGTSKDSRGKRIKARTSVPSRRRLRSAS